MNNTNVAICRNPSSKDIQAGNNAYISACAYLVFGKDHSKKRDNPGVTGARVGACLHTAVVAN